MTRSAKASWCVAVLASCSWGPTSETCDIAAAVDHPKTIAKPGSRMGIELFAFDGGSSFIPNKAMFHDAYRGQGPITLPVTCFLVVHPKGSLMWDTGHDQALGEPGARVPDRYMLKVKQSLTSQMAKIRMQPEDVNFLAFSHWHFDHTGNANLFTNATVIGQRDEHEYALGREANGGFGMKPSTYSGIHKNPSDLFIGDRDVFGDGSVRIVRVGGHTIGSQILIVRLSNRTIVLSGDIYHFAEQRKYRRVPPFNYDHAGTVTGMQRVEDVLAATADAELWITHDPEQMAQLRYAPEVYR